MINENENHFPERGEESKNTTVPEQEPVFENFEPIKEVPSEEGFTPPETHIPESFDMPLFVSEDIPEQTAQPEELPTPDDVYSDISSQSFGEIPTGFYNEIPPETYGETPAQVYNEAASDGYGDAFAPTYPQQPENEPSFNPYEANGVNPSYGGQVNNTAYNYNNSFGYAQNEAAGSKQTPTTPENSTGKLAALILIAICVVVAVVALGLGVKDNTPSTNDLQTSASDGILNTVATTSPTETLAPSTAAPTEATEQGMQILPTAGSIDGNNAVWVAEKVRPSVVGVMVYQNGQLAGEGSGVLSSVDSTGKYTYVVTCAHVINEQGVTYGILLLDGRSFTAEMVAIDERTDIGVLKVEATDLPVAEFGDSSTLKVGEPVYAIGNPGGSEYFGSMTNGIVSAIDRSINATYTMTCIQHNAAINPGNSGGALVNSAGQVIGINSSKIARTDYEGMGFAVPTAIAKPVVNALIEYGYVPNRPKLGIEYAPVSSYQLYSMVVSIKGLPQGSLVIAGISTDSSLAGTQAQVGDLIIGVNGQEMTDSSVLLDLIDTGAVGDTLTLNLCRIENKTYQTSTFDVTITLVEDKGKTTTEPQSTTSADGYYYGGSESFEDFFNDYFFGW